LDVNLTRHFVSLINSFSPAITAKYTEFLPYGLWNHDAWTKATDPAFKEDGINIYAWMLPYSAKLVTFFNGREQSRLSPRTLRELSQYHTVHSSLLSYHSLRHNLFSLIDLNQINTFGQCRSHVRIIGVSAETDERFNRKTCGIEYNNINLLAFNSWNS